MIEVEKTWPELFTLLFVVIGFIIAVILQNAFFSYLSVFLGGCLAGRTYYQKRLKEPILPFLLIIAGFLVGYLTGSFWVNRILILFYFTFGFIISYYLHKKKILVTFKSEQFIK